MIAHYPERALSWSAGRKVHAVWSRNPGGKVVIFIHGYGGDALGTWADFHELLPAQPKAAECDLIFYGYDGLRSDMTTSGEVFREFLNRVFDQPAALANPSLPLVASRPNTFRYTEAIIVAHSLGAVICRSALIESLESGTSWPVSVKLVLFAPAHMGANVVRLAISVISGLPFLGAAAGLWRFQSPLVDQLNVGSKELCDLLARTKTAIAKGHTHLIASKVIHAENEKIVSNLRFCADPPGIPFSGDHFSICKPNQDSSDPLIHVLGAL